MSGLLASECWCQHQRIFDAVHTACCDVLRCDSSYGAVQIEGSAKGGEIHLSDSQTKRDIDAAVATAYAEALANAKKHRDETSCVAWVSSEGCIYTEDHGAQCFDCEAHAVSYGAVQEINAIARARACSPLCLMLF